MTISEELDLIVDSIGSISNQKRYWLIRTQGGELYDTFRDKGFVALDHIEAPLSFLYDLKKTFQEDRIKILNETKQKIKSYCLEKKNSDSEADIDTRRIGLIASQINKFYFDFKKGDTVLIPSVNSETISFGIVSESQIASFGQEETNVAEHLILKKRVKWIKDLNRKDLDPYIYRMFTAHQALNDVGAYAEVIERSTKDLFVLDEEAHFIINVGAHDISASDFFSLGSEILNLIDKFAETYGLDVSSNDLQVTININSPGKIDLKSKIKKTTILAGLILAAFGGGYEAKNGTTFKTDGVPGLISSIDEFLKHQQEREMKEKVFNKYKDSLKIKQPDDMVQILKQFSDNKDLPK